MNVNKKLLFKVAVYVVMVIVFFVLETNVFNDFRVFDVKPNLIILLTVAVSIVENARYGAILGLVSGFLADNAFGSPFMMSGILYFFVGYLSGAAAKSYFGRTIISMIIMVVPAVVSREIVNLFYILAVWSDFQLSDVLLRYILPEFLYTLLFAIPVYFLVKHTAGKIEYV